MELITLVWNSYKINIIRRFATNVAQTLGTHSASNQKLSHNARIEKYFNERFDLHSVMKLVPEKYFTQNRQKYLQHLYLVDRTFATDIAKRVFHHIADKDDVVCETNAGLGLISTELLKMGIKKVRLYETCAQFRTYLKSLTKFSSRMEIYNKDLYSLHTLSYLDKLDKGYRVYQMLDKIPVRRWDADPVMTIIGPMANQSFIKYLIRMIVLEQEIAAYGRPQIFALMLPEDYTILNATPGMSLRIYQTNSILFQIFFDCELIEKYCKWSFLPWTYNRKVIKKEDEDYIFLVKIIPKANLPVSSEYLLHFYYYVKQGFQRGRQKVIPTLEKWLPGIGAKLIVLPENRRKYFSTNIDIFTEFGKLNSIEILQIFLVMLEQPEFDTSPFIPMMESHLVRDETIDSDLADLGTNITETEEEDGNGEDDDNEDENE